MKRKHRCWSAATDLHLCSRAFVSTPLFLHMHIDFLITALYRQMNRNMRKPTMWFLTRSDTNQAVQPLEMARGLKFCIYEVEVLYYPRSENKGPDHLRGYREADLRLCFRICRLLVFSWRGSSVLSCAELSLINEPRRQKTGLQGFRPGPTQTGLYSHRKWLETWNFGFRKQRDCTIQVAKTKALISFAVTAKLICVFVFAFAKFRFSHVAAQVYSEVISDHDQN